jgi:DhnA family fructose-bisphosphate aldolase class Ia
MDQGMQNCIDRNFQPDTSRTVMLAVDRGYFLAPTTRLEVAQQAVGPTAQRLVRPHM